MTVSLWISPSNLPKSSPNTISPSMERAKSFVASASLQETKSELFLSKRTPETYQSPWFIFAYLVRFALVPLFF